MLAHLYEHNGTPVRVYDDFSGYFVDYTLEVNPAIDEKDIVGVIYGRFGPQYYEAEFYNGHCLLTKGNYKSSQVKHWVKVGEVEFTAYQNRNGYWTVEGFEDEIEEDSRSDAILVADTITRKS